jgi:hypothetical protein
MKIYFAILLITLSLNSAWALPIVNENVANSGVMTIYPDSKDPHRYYIAPNVVVISKDNTGKPYFTYTEIGGWFSVTGLMQMTLVPAYTRDELDGAKAEIVKKDNQAQFSGLPFIESSLALTGNLPELISDNQCNHQGGLIGQEEACTMVLTSLGRNLFRTALSKRSLFTTLQFDYSVQAVVSKADGTFADQTINHGIAVRIDGDQLSQYPELINLIH